jgi:RNA polymerase sigma factor for flagellar operon FliA
MDSTTKDAPKHQRREEEFQNIVFEQMPQVKCIVRRIHEHLPQHVPFEDLVHAGIAGLIDALNKFDSEKDVKFASYAKFRIRSAILDSLREMDWSPRDLRRKFRQIDIVMQKLPTELGRTVAEPRAGKGDGTVAARSAPPAE